MTFDISMLVDELGEAFTVSGISRTYNDRGDPTESYAAHTISGIIQIMDGTEEEVQEGLLAREDLIIFVDENTGGVSALVNGNYMHPTTTTSGVFRITSVIHNPGHFEVFAKKI